MRIGRYEIIEKLAVGGMGEVYRAAATGAEGFVKPVALKRIFPELADNAKYRRMFVEEAKLAARLAHPNIVQVFDLGGSGDELYIAMELVDGCDLAQVLTHHEDQERGLSAAAVATVAFDVLEALTHAHNLRAPSGKRQGVIHQDVSPSNILIARTGFMKLCDFGIARVLREALAEENTSVRGKMGYMSPEQALRHPVDARSDIFSLGVVLYEASTGRRLFPSAVEFARAVESGWEAPPLLAEVPNFSPVLAHSIQKALRRNASERFQTAERFREEIEDFLLTVGPGRARGELRSVVAAIAPPPRATEEEDRAVSRRWTQLVQRAITGDHDDDTHVALPGAHPISDEFTGETPIVPREALEAASAFANPAGDTDETTAIAPAGPVAMDDGPTEPSGQAPTSSALDEFIEGGTTVVTARPLPEQLRRRTTEFFSGLSPRGRAVAIGGGGVLLASLLVLLSMMPDAPQASGDASAQPAGADLLEPPPDLEIPPPPEEVAEPAVRRSRERARSGSQEARGARGGGAQDPRPKPSPARRSAPARPTRAGDRPEQSTAILNLNALPWAHVTIDGQKVPGQTPLLNHRLPAGPHVIVLEGPNSVRKTLRLNLRPNSTTNRVVDLSGEP